MCEMGASGFLEKRMQQMLKVPREGVSGWCVRAVSLPSERTIESKHFTSLNVHVGRHYFAYQELDGA